MKMGIRSIVPNSECKKYDRVKAKVEFSGITPGDLGTVVGRCSTKTMDGAENRVQVKWDKGGSHNWQPGTHFDIVGSVEADYRVPDSPKKGAAAEA